MSFGFGFGFPKKASVAGGPSLSLNFLSGTLDPRVTFTRASTATYFDSSGVLTTASSNTPRFDYNPVTLAAQGLLIEEQRTNSIRNNTMVGAVAGTPGTGPTNWSLNLSGTGVTRQIVGTGVENGINYIDIRYSGTATSNVTIWITNEPNNGVAAANGQTWTYSVYAKIAAGSFTGFNTPQLFIDEYSAAVGYLTGQVTNLAIPTSTFTRVSSTRTLSNASTAFVVAGYRFYANSGNTVDITLRIGLPQLEQGAFATSVIPTSGTATTRAADSASMTGTNFSSWYNATEGSIYFEVVSAPVSNILQQVAYISDSSSNNAMFLRRTSSATPGFAVVVGGVAQADVNSGTAAASSTYKVGCAYKVDNFAISLNSGAVGTDTSGTIPVVSQINLGSGLGTSQFLNGSIKKFAFYPRRLSNSELQAITS